MLPTLVVWGFVIGRMGVFEASVSRGPEALSDLKQFIFMVKLSVHGTYS